MYNDRVASGFLEENLPNVINQADILQSTTHFLTTRGDMFSVMVYDSYDDLFYLNKKLGRRFK